jgi:hypothetical protein
MRVLIEAMARVWKSAETVEIVIINPATMAITKL